MHPGLFLLQKTDWPKLHHAYGPASDTPQHLQALLGDDQEARRAAVSHLGSAIMHQGTPWTATGPVALVVAGFLLDEERSLDLTLQVDLMYFLVDVAEAAESANRNKEELQRMVQFDLTPFLESDDEYAMYEDEDAANAFYAQAGLGCIDAAPVLSQVMRKEMDSEHARLRALAAMGETILAKLQPSDADKTEITSKILALARAAHSPDERSAHVLALGEVGYAPEDFLEDPSPAVRMCAALAPGLATNPRAINELIDILEQNAGQVDDWFEERPPQFIFYPRFQIVRHLVAQVTDFNRLTKAANAVVDITEKSCVDFDWGPLLAAAFPDGDGVIKNKSQKRFLSALVEKTELWDPLFGNARTWFRAAGLPNDREACAKLITEANV